MRIRVGFEMVYDCPAPTPMIVLTNVHFSRASDLTAPDHITIRPSVPVSYYRDSFGNWCVRLTAPTGRISISADAVIQDSSEPDAVLPAIGQHSIETLPDETLMFLVGSRYCETDKLADAGWKLFGSTPPGWARVQAVCDFVHRHIQFGYEHARSTKSALEVFEDPRGVCRDYAHLAISFCRILNIPARYCTGYLSDIGIPPPHGTMDFAAWFEAYLDGAWHTFDPRNNSPRRGRVLIARGRDAADVPITQSFGTNTLASFKVWTEEVP